MAKIDIHIVNAFIDEINQGRIDRVFVGGKAALKQKHTIELNP
jgi:hypothetical protein